MPATEVLFFKEEDGSVPVLDWLNRVRERDERPYRKCFELIGMLKQFGHELRRPRADMLRDGVYELRTRVGKVNYRILYGFVGKDVALLVESLTKEKTVPSHAINEAVRRIELFKANPEAHRFSLEEDN
jgi:hypothetical protein